MAIGKLRIALNPGANPEEFETFVRDELLPAAKTVIRSRIGRTPIRHTVLRSNQPDGETSPPSYLWKIEQNYFDAETYAFPTDVGPELKARLESFGSLEFRVVEEDFGQIVAQSSEELTTPSEGTFDSDPRGWITPDTDR